MRRRRSGGMDVTLLGSAVVPYVFTDSDAEAYVAAFSTQPSNTVKLKVDTFFQALKTASLYTKIDVMWWPGAPTSQAALLNMKNPATFTLTEVSSPTFTANQGYAGNGTSSYLNTGWDPTNNGSAYQENSAHMAYYSRTNSTGTVLDMGSRSSSANEQTYILGRSASNTAQFRMNQDANGSFAPASTDSSGFFIGTRTGATALALYRNGASLGTDNTSSGGITAMDFYICAANRNNSPELFSTRQIAFASLGGGLNGTEAANFDSAVQALVA